jgi:uncharacterized protein (DUF1800 family)
MEASHFNRLTYGFSFSEYEKVKFQSLAEFVEKQLNPTSEDPSVQKKLQELKLAVEYEHRVGNKTKKIKEDRPLRYLNASTEALWVLTREGVHYEEKQLPAHEVRIASWIRAVYSQWQVQELMAEFWHNHFSVSTEADERISICLPVYDRDVIRKHAFGNFRELLGSVSESTPMLIYLDNYVSRASPANENYARELFELHTMGADSYLNHLYNRWREVPGAPEGKPIGYIDEDVYEASRAFTGWTIADGSDDEKGGRFPNTGKFYYHEGWHDNYQKRLLATELAPNQAPLRDGQRVLDLVAFHPATAKHVCTKLCTRFISDNPPQTIIDKAAKTWMDNLASPDQIKKTLQTIFLSVEFAQSTQGKLKRPFELMASIMRATQLDFTPNTTLNWMLGQLGYMHFMWPTPTGHPDTETYWLSSNMLLTRWNIVPTLLLEDWHKLTNWKKQFTIPLTIKSCRQFVDFYCDQMLAETASEEVMSRLRNLLAAGGEIDDEPVGSVEEIEDRKRKMICLLCMCPTFQYR